MLATCDPADQDRTSQIQHRYLSSIITIKSVAREEQYFVSNL